MHTLGPWETDAQIGARAGSCWIAPLGNEDDGRVFCYLHGNKYVKPDDKRKSGHSVLDAEDVANARLMASAPELLAALQQLLQDHIEILGDAVGEKSTACRAARDAIAKATGQ